MYILDLEEYCHHYRLVHVEHSERVISGLQLVFVEFPKITPHAYAEKKGLAKGREEGLVEGLEKGCQEGGVAEGILLVASNLKKQGLPVDVIAQVTQLEGGNN